MDEAMIDLQVTVDKVLQRWPKTLTVFMKHKTKCVGCFMQHFCTLKDVADTYQLSAEKLIDDSVCQRGLLSVCIREVQKSLRDSAKRLIETGGPGLGIAVEDDRLRDALLRRVPAG